MSGSVSPEPEMETEPETIPHAGSESDRDGVLGLVVLYSSEGNQVGGFMPVPEGKGRLLGRGPARADDEHVRVKIAKQRPGQLEELGPLEHKALSRKQLLLRRVESDTLEVENLGRCALLFNGEAVSHARARPGDVLELGSQLVLFVTTRPARFSGGSGGPDHRFGEPDRFGFVGESPAAWRLRSAISAVATLAGHVLVLGSTGTGKELVARALHALSHRNQKLISRNAATLPELLVDAELFGNMKNYPNPGTPDREGLIGAADGGTLFLDEFAELPPGAQAHFLRALDQGEYQRLGETTVRKARFRLIAATNRPESALRRDLLERFPFRIAVPDLARRREDIPLIARHLFSVIRGEAPDLANRFTTDDGSPKFSPTFVRCLSRHPFQGNVRELGALLYGSLHESRSGWLEWPEALAAAPSPGGPALLPSQPGDSDEQAPVSLAESSLERGGVREEIKDIERQRILQALAACQGNQTRAADLLGMPRRTLVTRLAQLDIPRPRKR